MRQLSLKSRVVALACVAIAATACKKDDPKPAEPPKTEEAKPAEAAAAPAEATPATAPGDASPAAAPAGASPTAAAGPDAATVIQPGVPFMFDIEASPGARAGVLADCIAKAGKDSAKMAACPAEVSKAGASEGIRFEKEGDQWIYVSFGTKGEGEEIFLRAPVVKLESAAHEFKFKPSGPATGSQVAPENLGKFDQAKADAMVMVVEVVDATTVAMNAPPPKGRLVYHKK